MLLLSHLGFVGVTGLVRRLALDRCLPEFLLARNKLRDTNHYIIVGFCLICISLYLLVQGDVGSLSGTLSPYVACETCYLVTHMIRCIHHRISWSDGVVCAWKHDAEVQASTVLPPCQAATNIFLDCRGYILLHGDLQFWRFLASSLGLESLCTEKRPTFSILGAVSALFFFFISLSCRLQLC